MDTKPKKKVTVDPELRLISLGKASEMLAERHPHLWRNYDALRWLALNGKLKGVVSRVRCHWNNSYRCRYRELVKRLEWMEGRSA